MSLSECVCLCSAFFVLGLVALYVAGRWSWAAREEEEKGGRVESPLPEYKIERSKDDGNEE